MISVYIPFHGATASPISNGAAFRTPFSGQRMSPRRYWKPVQTPSWRKRKPTSSSRFFTQTAYWCNTAWMSVLPSYGPW